MKVILYDCLMLVNKMLRQMCHDLINSLFAVSMLEIENLNTSHELQQPIQKCLQILTFVRAAYCLQNCSLEHLQELLHNYDFNSNVTFNSLKLDERIPSFVLALLLCVKRSGKIIVNSTSIKLNKYTFLNIGLKALSEHEYDHGVSGYLVMMAEMMKEKNIIFDLEKYEFNFM